MAATVPKATAVNPNTVPTTKANGFANATVHQQPQQQTIQQQQQQQHQPQQIDKVTGLPVPAPRRSNSIPLGDRPAETTSTALATTAAPASTQNGSASGTSPAATDSAETQVCSVVPQKVCLFISIILSSFFSLRPIS